MEANDQLNAPADLTPGNLRYPLHRRLGGPQSRSGRCGEDKYCHELMAARLIITGLGLDDWIY
jgi:hypothetical protein